MPVFMRFFSHSDVIALKNKRDVHGLQEVLAHEKDRPTRIAAAEALGAIGDDRAVISLILVLAHDSGDVRMFAAVALGKIGDGRAVASPHQIARGRPSHGPVIGGPRPRCTRRRTGDRAAPRRARR